MGNERKQTVVLNLHVERTDTEDLNFLAQSQNKRLGFNLAHNFSFPVLTPEAGLLLGFPKLSVKLRIALKNSFSETDLYPNVPNPFKIEALEV
ncbi:hypothetical protein IQ249_11885 [Lusitaniella coriacea LEGE 07157]|uniref:Uncharacterized protein n=1 Tax=Lusitaniella coriacea LEGE 07157 TaxID=945747 RepID=A0A8J7DX72_9CYAN|nr:hypothetical protein [Lusitaniella coriacea]MBE9116600.1 hypothetical protein [Lusitaniella coriacea LEGE 07157]